MELLPNGTTNERLDATITFARADFGPLLKLDEAGLAGAVVGRARVLDSRAVPNLGHL